MRSPSARRFFDSICSNTAIAAAQETGLPPNVPPRPPGCDASMISARPVTAASGMPPAMPLADNSRSGTSPKCSLAKYLPVRAMPLWISSAMNTTPFAVHHSCRAGRNPSAGTMNPPSPWIGSTTRQAKSAAPTVFSR